MTWFRPAKGEDLPPGALIRAPGMGDAVVWSADDRVALVVAIPKDDTPPCPPGMSAQEWAQRALGRPLRSGCAPYEATGFKVRVMETDQIMMPVYKRDLLS